MYERVETTTELQFYGAAFVDVIETYKPIIVDGDLISKRIAAPSIQLSHGSLICPKIECPLVHAEILGLFDLGGPFAPPQGWTYQWLRPVLPDGHPDERRWTGTESIQCVAAMLRHPAIVTDSSLVEPLLIRALARPTCNRARVLFDAAIDELAQKPHLLTPLGVQIVTALILNDTLPRHWRF
jgi:hypothetical protein